MGKKDWEKENIDVGYVSGQKMAIGSSKFDLSNSIAVGEIGDIIVTFEVPSKYGEYATTWGLYRGDTVFCEFSFRIALRIPS